MKAQKSDIHSPYVPAPVVVEGIEPLTEREKLFTVSYGSGEAVEFFPGQFFMVGIPGYGEAPISISAGDGVRFELCVRAVGNVTNALHRLEKGDRIWLRGPFGRGFKKEEMRSRDLLFLAGGIGMVPMRSLIREVLSERGSYGRLTLLYGARNPGELLFREEIKEWEKKGLEARLTIDLPRPGWRGPVGVITTLIPGVEVDEKRTTAVIIGPPVMYKFVILGLASKRMSPRDILLSLERRMKCGLGKCGHCQINSVYACQEGPVFRLSELKGLVEAV